MNRTHRIVAAAAAALLASAAGAHDAHHQHAGAAPAAADAPAVQGKTVQLADTLLVDQDGRKLRLASDVVGDKLAVVSFVFTNCPDVCPLVSHAFSQVQERLGTLVGDRVRLVSLSVDPARDTPARLKEYAASYSPRPGWLWLTGEPANVTAALQSFGVKVTQADMHPNVVMVGDLRTGRWTRVYQTDNPQKILAAVKDHLGSGHQNH